MPACASDPIPRTTASTVTPMVLASRSSGNIARALRLTNALNDLAFHGLKRPLDDFVDVRKASGSFGGTFCQHTSATGIRTALRRGLNIRAKAHDRVRVVTAQALLKIRDGPVTIIGEGQQIHILF